MTIIFNTDQIYLHGGIEKVMATKANYFANLPNVEVYIVTTEQDGQKPRYELDPNIKLIDLGIDYDRARSYFSWFNIKKAFGHYKKQKNLFRNLKPDVIISPNYNFDHYWLPFIKGKTQLVKERHSSRYQEGNLRNNASFGEKIMFTLNDWIEEKYNAIVVLNKDEEQYVKSNNAVVIPNPIESQDIKAILEAPKVIAAGRISPVKNFGDLIKAWAIVNKTFPDWQLDIYGEDYLGTQQKLERLIVEFNLGKTIHFKKSINNIPQKMTEYSIYAMSSESECFPMVLLEALSVGLPIVSYDCPNGPRNIITHQKNGVLVEHLNINKLAEALIYLIENDELRQQMGDNAKVTAQKYSTQQVMIKWQNLLNLRHV